MKRAERKLQLGESDTRVGVSLSVVMLSNAKHPSAVEGKTKRKEFCRKARPQRSVGQFRGMLRASSGVTQHDKPKHRASTSRDIPSRELP